MSFHPPQSVSDRTLNGVRLTATKIAKLRTRRNRFLQTLLGAIAIVLCAGFAIAPCEAAENWTPFSPEVGVSMGMPGEVQTLRKDGKETGPIESYKAEDDKYVYTVTTEVHDSDVPLDDVIVEVKKLLQKDGFKKSTDPQDSTGQKWKGKRFQLSTDSGDSSLAMQIATDDELTQLVSQTTTAPIDSAEAQKFFSSLSIDSDAIKAQKTKESEEFLKKVFQPTSFVGWAGLAMAGFGGIAWFVGWVCLIIVAFRTSLLWGLAMFIPGNIGSLLFLCFNFRRAWPPFALQLFGIVMTGVGIAMCVPGTIDAK